MADPVEEPDNANLLFEGEKNGTCVVEFRGGRRFHARISQEYVVWKVQAAKARNYAIRLDGIAGVIFPEAVDRVMGPDEV